MDLSRAQQLLLDILKYLPEGTWWMIQEKENDDLGLATALGLPRVEIDALLVNAGICKESVKKGITFSYIKWERFITDGIDYTSPIRVGDIDRIPYVANGKPTVSKPSLQSRSSEISTPPVLPDNIIKRLQQSNQHYNKKKDNMVSFIKQKDQVYDAVERRAIDATVAKIGETAKSEPAKVPISSSEKFLAFIGFLYTIFASEHSYTFVFLIWTFIIICWIFVLDTMNRVERILASIGLLYAIFAKEYSYTIGFLICASIIICWIVQVVLFGKDVIELHQKGKEVDGSDSEENSGDEDSSSDEDDMSDEEYYKDRIDLIKKGELSIMDACKLLSEIEGKHGDKRRKKHTYNTLNESSELMTELFNIQDDYDQRGIERPSELRSLMERVYQTGTKLKNYEIDEEEALIDFGAQKDDLERMKDKLGLHEVMGVTTDTSIQFVEVETLELVEEFKFVFKPAEWNSMTTKELFSFYLNEKCKTQKVSLKSLRFKHNGTVLFLSSIGSKSPHSLGIKDRDKIYVTEYTPEPVVSKPTTKKTKVSTNNKKKKGRKIKSRNKASNQSYDTVDEEEKLRRLHSKAISRVFEQAESIYFKSIRKRLNDMNLERTEPKLKKNSKKVDTSPKSNMTNQLPDGLGDKALKSRFVINVGEVQNLYKSTKPSSNRRKASQAVRENITVDLHGLSKADALQTLDDMLPEWVEIAMKGDDPWVIPVTIICGKGGQYLSEVVEDWIKRNDKVANAPRSMYL